MQVGEFQVSHRQYRYRGPRCSLYHRATCCLSYNKSRLHASRLACQDELQEPIARTLNDAGRKVPGCSRKTFQIDCRNCRNGTKTKTRHTRGNRTTLTVSPTTSETMPHEGLQSEAHQARVAAHFAFVTSEAHVQIAQAHPWQGWQP